MDKWPKWTIVGFLLVAGVLLGLLVEQPEAQQKNILVSKKVAAGPALDGTMEGAWNAAAPLTVKAVGGKNLPGGSTDVTIRSLYTEDMVYLLVQYKDQTQSEQRSPWKKQPDGSWVVVAAAFFFSSTVIPHTGSFGMMTPPLGPLVWTVPSDTARVLCTALCDCGPRDQARREIFQPSPMGTRQTIMIA